VIRRLASLLAALLLGSAAGVVAAAGPAAAAACPAGTGVTVVVGSSVSCDSNGGGPASANFRDTGHTLTPVDRQPGFVCQVDGAPSSASCVNTPPADAYWGLFWSDGTSGTWVYASQGVGTLKVPAGGSVAFVFQTGSAKTYPGVDPGTAASAPSPTTRPSPTSTSPTKKPAVKPSRKPAAKPTATAAAPTAGATATPEPTASATTTPEPTAEATTPSPGATATTKAPEPSDEVERTSSDVKDDGGSGSSLGWVAGVLVVALLGGMGAVLWRRRAAGGSS